MRHWRGLNGGFVRDSSLQPRLALDAVDSSNLSTAATVLPVVVTSGLRIARKSPLKGSLGSNGPFGAVAIEKVGKQHNEARRSEPFSLDFV